MDFFKLHMPWVVSFVLAALLVAGYVFALAPPPNFPSGNSVVIARGASVPDIADELFEAHIVTHPLFLRLMLHLSGANTYVQAGTYRFSVPQNLFTVAYRLTTGDYGIPPVRIVFPEGTTVRDMAKRVAETFPEISITDFLSAEQLYEGYLFPDTYLFLPWTDAGQLVQTMRENFNTKISPLLPEISASGHSLSDIVIMASLIEKEARTTAVRHMVAGILWNRFKLGMPLQVDAVFGYIFNRDTYSPSLADLKVDSPYNTYTHTGLPPGPINNPGLDSLDAALHPTETNYLYYLTDTNGVMHYATTYTGHQTNRKKYLY